mgnify:CR=1 FL=1
MAAGRFVVPPYFPARNRDFDLLSGAKLYVYDNLTTDKANIYTDEALTVLSANPVVANSSGQFPAIWAQAGTEAEPVLYSVSVTTSTGASPGNPFNFDNYRPSVDWETAAAALAEAAAALAVAEASAAAVSADEAAADAVLTAADLAAIEAIIADAPDAPSVLNKLNRNGDNASAGLLAAIGEQTPALTAMTEPIVDSDILTGYRAGLKKFTASVFADYIKAFFSASGGSALVGTLQSGTGGVAEPLQNWFRRVGIWPEQFGALGGGADDQAAVQRAFTAVQDGGSIYLSQMFTIEGSGVTLTNKNRVRIWGPGGLILKNSAPDAATLIDLAGTCDQIVIDGITLRGTARDDAAARQNGIFNVSGQTLSNIRISNVVAEDLNCGIGFNAESSGTVKQCSITNTTVRRSRGVDGGQGYGIFVSRVEDVTIGAVQIEACERHGFYASRLAASAGENDALQIYSMTVRDHRLGVSPSATRAAVFIGRGFGAKVIGLTVVDYFGGAIAVLQDTGGSPPPPPARSAGDIQFIGTTLTGRMDTISSIQIGEGVIPTTATLERVQFRNTTVVNDLTSVGAALVFEINNGMDISIVDTDITLLNMAAVAHRLIFVGTFAAGGDTGNIYVQNTKFRGTSSGSPVVSNVRLASALCTSSDKIVVTGAQNDSAFTFTNIEFVATQTNTNITNQVAGQVNVGLYVAGETTPSVAGGVEFLSIANSGATSITNFLGGTEGQQITLNFRDANTTLVYGGSTMRVTIDGSDITSVARRTVVLVYVAGVWETMSVYTVA